MAQTNSQSNASGVVRHASGYLNGTYTAADVTLTLGFVPKHFRITNVTDRLTQEWYEGMNSGDFLEQIAAGDRTLETDDKIVVNSDGTVTVKADGGIITDNDTVVWEAFGG